MTYIVAHRGASFHAPENTISAFRKAIALGADGIETDVQLTADSQLVIHHNYSVDGTTCSTGKIADMTLAQLKALDFGSHKGSEYAGERIATLEECLEVSSQLTLVNIELKAPINRDIPYVKMVIDAIKAKGMEEKVIISAFDHSLLRQTKTLCPKLRVGALTLPTQIEQSPVFSAVAAAIPKDKQLSYISAGDLRLSEKTLSVLKGMDIIAKNPEAMLLELINSLAAIYPRSTLAEVMEELDQQKNLVAYVRSLDFHLDYLHPQYYSVLADETLVSRLAAIGVGVSPYTPDGKEELRKLYNGGCYSIITNRPDILLEMKKK